MSSGLRGILSLLVLAVASVPLAPLASASCEAPLKEMAKQFRPANFMVGGTAGWREAEGKSGEILDREFDYITPENEFKQRVVHPSPGVWDWTLADAWSERIASKGQVMRIHGPVGPQSSRWAKADERTGDELRPVMREYVAEMAKRYNGKPHVLYWDVVNESILSNGKWHGAQEGDSGWENPWIKMGFDESHALRPPAYIAEAFEIAGRLAPDIKLIINQQGGMQARMWNRLKSLVQYLRERGLRIDGIGWQAHVSVGWEKNPENIARLEALIDWTHQHQLSFHVTENTVWIRPGEGDFEDQARTFGAIFDVLLRKSDQGVVTWNIWNISDHDVMKRKRSWRGTLFSKEHVAKPSYYEIRRLLCDSVGR